MTKRVDKASRLIQAPASLIYNAFTTSNALERWLPPQGMKGEMLAFDFHEGGTYRIRLSYLAGQHTPGKTTDNADEVEVRFVRLIRDQRIEQAVTFDSEDREFAGVMRISWNFQEVGPGKTRVTVACEDVPEGTSPEDHEAGLTSTLQNLAAFVEERKAIRDKNA